MLLGTVTKEKNLEMKRPGAHIVVEIRQIGIIGYGFVGCIPAQPLPYPLGE